MGKAASSLRDVSPSLWYTTFVLTIVQDGIASGYKDHQGKPTGMFGPANPVTNAEILKMALVAAGKNVLAGTPKNPSARGDWSAPYVNTAENLYLSVNVPDLNVRDHTSRGAAVQMVLEIMGIPLKAAANPFTDLPSSSPYTKALETAAKLGIIRGDTDASGKPVGTVRPDALITRAEVAKILALARKRLKK